MQPYKAKSASSLATDVVNEVDRERIRLSLDLSPELNGLLEYLANATDASKSDVLRKGIRLMEVLVKARQQGKKFGVAEPDQPLVTEIVGL